MNILLETETHLFWEEEGIICFRYKVPVVDLEVARKGTAMRAKATKNEQRLVYADCSVAVRTTSEARIYYASVLTSKTTMALAVHVPNWILKILATAFLNFNRPKMPYRFFSNKQKAFNWLHEIGKRNDQLSMINKQ
jgi:hypothetical protein